MKRLIAAAVLVAIITLSCIAGQTTVNRCGEEVGKLLDSAESAAVSGELDAARDFAQQAEDAYSARESMTGFFINHELVENLGVQLSRLPELAGEETTAEFLSELQGARIMLTHAVNDNKPSLLRIF